MVEYSKLDQRKVKTDQSLAQLNIIAFLLIVSSAHPLTVAANQLRPPTCRRGE